MDDFITDYTTPGVKAAEPVPSIGKRNTQASERNKRSQYRAVKLRKEAAI